MKNRVRHSSTAQLQKSRTAEAEQIVSVGVGSLFSGDDRSCSVTLKNNREGVAYDCEMQKVRG